MRNQDYPVKLSDSERSELEQIARTVNTQIAQQPGQFFVKTHRRTLRIVELGIQGQNRSHPLNKGRRQRGDTPLTYLPGLEKFFCSSKRTLSTEIRSTIPSATSNWKLRCSAIVQRILSADASVVLLHRIQRER